MSQTENKPKVKIAVLIGGGSRLPAIYSSLQKPASSAELVLVLSYKKQSTGLEWAIEQGLNARYWRWSEWRAAGHSRSEYDAALAELLLAQGVELVVLAGWGLLLTHAFLDRFPNRIINVHPALLSETFESYVKLEDGSQIEVFRGNNAIELALQAGVSVTGCTVHYVTEEMDAGPILLRQEVPVLPGDTVESLGERIHAAEDQLLPQGIELAAQRLLAGGRV
ncbi:MAG TPA: phosphoribosylglycinamide formyltransferase [Chloroflexia bacterium]|nr:phosphoribosylglycinamide formyltransferase [Chloroflexia bacterium]